MSRALGVSTWSELFVPYFRSIPYYHRKRQLCASNKLIGFKNHVSSENPPKNSGNITSFKATLAYLDNPGAALQGNIFLQAVALASKNGPFVDDGLNKVCQVLLTNVLSGETETMAVTYGVWFHFFYKNHWALVWELNGH